MQTATHVAEVLSTTLKADLLKACNHRLAEVAATIAEGTVITVSKRYKSGKLAKAAAKKKAQAAFDNISAQTQKFQHDLKGLMHTLVVSEGVHLVTMA